MAHDFAWQSLVYYTFCDRFCRKGDEFHAHMVKKYPDFERGESASLTGRTHIPPRLFKQAARLSRQKDKLMLILSEMNPISAKAKSRDVAALLDEYIPGVEELMTRLKKTSKVAKEIRRTLRIREGDPSLTTLTPIDRFCWAIHSLAQRITAE